MADRGIAMRRRGKVEALSAVDARIGRRHVLGLGAMGLIAAVSGGLSGDRQAEAADQRNGRLSARPGPPTGSWPTGLQPLGLGDQRDGLLYVPAGYQADRPAP